MKHRFMDIAACPMCKHFPLELYVIETKEYPEREEQIKRLLEKYKPPLCEIYCYKLQTPIGKKIEELQKEGVTPPCDECLKIEVVTGVIYCPNCGRWYPIIDEIPRMLPDNLRKKNEDLKFLKKYAEKLPEKITREGKPWNLSEEGA
ncbi:MAG: Trm112 family protein [Crenarchaeota archaeon]|nr:Trm112 family protein [Thermoproteota archaeon]